MGGSNCAVHTCYFGKPKKHRFPNPKKDMQRFKKWLSLVGNKELLEKPPEKVYENCRVCGDHFVESDMGPNSVLLKSAVPSLKLPDPLYIDESPQTESMESRDQNAIEIFSITKVPTIAGPSRKTEHMREFDLNHPDIKFAINLGMQIQALNDVTGTIKPKLKADLQCLVNNACLKALDKKQVTNVTRSE